MAVVKDSSCMFCSPEPCVCNNKPARRPTRPKVERVRASPSPVPVVEVTLETGSLPGQVSKVGATEVAPSTVQPDRPLRRTRPNLAGVTRVRDPLVEAENTAITVFAEADMLHHETLEELRDRIQLPPTRIDALIWRMKNREQVNGK